ncbi:MAG TPA: YidC/Oxa1 family membrane protein insertase, partial [bacterium]|nr:YidC/Oxa1 family membrane protein insertase [bacterium]
MNILYDIFIYPLEFLMQIVLEEALSFTGSPLISLVCVSIAVSLGSLPLYHIAESWQDKEREIQKKLKPKISEFKAIFKGSALNSYISTLYRQNGYHPVFAVRTSFGLLIQIPFFFAAYHLLSNYTAFNGVETLFFKDLGKPDSLITVGGLSINVFPFLMTAVNLISASIYGKKTTFKENLQLYGMALLF